MPLYENVFIARQDISGAQVDALADTFTQLIADQGGEVKKRDYWGLRNLAYRMKKNRKGHYVLLNIDGPSAGIAALRPVPFPNTVRIFLPSNISVTPGRKPAPATPSADSPLG